MVKINDEAIDLITNSDFLLAKNEIISKLTKELYQMAKETRVLFKHQFTAEPKVSRGENLKGLPYLVLDFPRIFKEEDVFAFRTLFWWGNYISCSLHLKGKYIEPNVVESILSHPQLNEAYLSFNGDEWNHDLHSNDYKKTKEFDIKTLDWSSIPFIKISCLLELKHINILENFYTINRDLLMKKFYGNKF